MTSDQPHRQERLGDTPGFEAWADEVRTTLEARRQDAAERAARGAAAPELRLAAHPKRKRRFLYLPFS